LIGDAAGDVKHEGECMLRDRAIAAAHLCVPKTSSALISGWNYLTSAHHGRAAMFRNGRPGRAIQVTEPA
jgi:hypothetical protein